MSLVNEALKRTRDASYSGGAISAPSLGNYRMAPAAAKPVFGIWHLIVVGAIILGLVAGTYQFARTRISSLREVITHAETAPASAAASVEAQSVSMSIHAPPATRFEVVSPEQARAAEDALVERLISRLQSPPSVATAAAVNREPPQTAEPVLKLQGIMRDHDSFEAMINGYTYRVGDEIEGGRITAIDQRLVQIEIDGRQLELRLR